MEEKRCRLMEPEEKQQEEEGEDCKIRDSMA